MPLRDVVKDFKGSPDGCQVIQYRAGQQGVDIVPSLCEVSDAEGWTVPHKAAAPVDAAPPETAGPTAGPAPKRPRKPKAAP